MADNTFQLLDLGSEYAFEFQYFPEEIETSDRANWVPQETTIGTKPLFYANGEPMRISVRELHLDSTETETTLTTDLEILRLFKTEIEEGGPPPALLAIWGDYKVRCVLEDLTIRRILFNDDGDCVRAKISLELVELQEEGEAVSVTVGGDEPTNTENPFGL